MIGVQQVDLVALKSGVHRVGEESFGGASLTACGRLIAGGTDAQRRPITDVTCVECLVGAGYSREAAQLMSRQARKGK